MWRVNLDIGGGGLAMIGVVGPEDSVALAIEIAQEMGRSDDLVSRVYQDPAEAGELALALDPLCETLLFTGQVPYAIATSSATLSSEAQVIDHSGADLYRVIARVLLASGGEFPRVSVDALDPRVIKQVFRDLDLPPPAVILPATNADGDVAYVGLESWTQAHQNAIEAGSVDAVLTCLSGAHDELAKRGTPVWRIEHSRVTVTDALERAFLTSDLRSAHSSQIAIAVAQANLSSDRIAGGQPQIRRNIEMQQDLIEHTDKAGGHLTLLGSDRYMITTTRGAIDRMITRYSHGQASLFDLSKRWPSLRMGVGVGYNFAAANTTAEQALQATDASSRVIVVYPDGEAKRLDGMNVSHTRLQETSAAALELATALGVGTLSLQRLVNALRQLDSSAVSSRQLADAYGVQTRSARRLLGALRQAGFATAIGVRTGPRSGRPQTLFKVDLARLANALDSP